MNGHREGRLAHKTLRSVVRAADAALARGVACELVVVLDRPDRATAEFFEEQSELVDRIETVDFGDPAPARNHGARVASGALLAFIDCDDLVSGNWLAEAVRARSELDPGAPVVLHPEWNVVFDAAHVLSRHVPPDDACWRAENFVEHNYWTAPVVVDRETMLRFPYRPHAEGSGFGFEDWDWNLVTLASGVRHRVVAGTRIYIRRKHSGSRMLREIADSAIVRPSAGFDWIVDRVAAAGGGADRLCPPPLDDAAYLDQAFSDPAFLGDMTAVASIEPLLEPTAQRLREFVPWDWARVFSPLGRAFCEALARWPAGVPQVVVCDADPAAPGAARAARAYAALREKGAAAIVLGVSATGASWQLRLNRGGEEHRWAIEVGDVDAWRRPLLVTRLLLQRPPASVHLFGGGLVLDVLARHGVALASGARLFLHADGTDLAEALALAERLPPGTLRVLSEEPGSEGVAQPPADALRAVSGPHGVS